ncbi:hypothetical protein [Butyrivibrio sp. VCB2006]|uniref:hypothetical protein n=1 Tax=Butyrivibrio sp. VCB2006 TaxID=1280679 RepID=UPI0004155629|nr:hypothetical protein [Butyrivibrio sp. VCB2006]
MRKGGFCRFYKNLYWGNSVKKRTLVKWKLYTGSGQFNVFCVTKAMDDNDQLDIIHCAFLKQQYYRKHPVLIYGIASSYNEAVEIVLQISRDASEVGMDGRLMDYLLMQE